MPLIVGLGAESLAHTEVASSVKALFSGFGAAAATLILCRLVYSGYRP
ncbi:hypothetical protein ACFQ7B_20135 [Streptomyces erythrochromogenes]